MVQSNLQRKKTLFQEKKESPFTLLALEVVGTGLETEKLGTVYLPRNGVVCFEKKRRPHEFGWKKPSGKRKVLSTLVKGCDRIYGDGKRLVGGTGRTRIRKGGEHINRGLRSYTSSEKSAWEPLMISTMGDQKENGSPQNKRKRTKTDIGGGLNEIPRKEIRVGRMDPL